MRAKKPFWLVAMEQALGDGRRAAHGRSLVFAHTNCFGQRWAARVMSDGVVVTGENVGWAKMWLTPVDVAWELALHERAAKSNTSQANRALNAPLHHHHVITDAERAWWISVL